MMAKSYNFFKNVLFFLVCFSSSMVSAQQLNLTPVKDKKLNKGIVFTAIYPSKDIKKGIKDIQHQLSKAAGKKFSPSPIKNLHVSLQRFDRKDANTITIPKKIDASITKSLKDYKKFTIGGLSGKNNDRFIKVSKGGVVMLKFKSKNLSSLVNKIKAGLDKAKIRKFETLKSDHLHITLGWLKKSKKKIDLKKISLSALDKASFPVSNVVLLKSNKPRVPRAYPQVAAYPLQ